MKRNAIVSLSLLSCLLLPRLCRAQEAPTVAGKTATVTLLSTLSSKAPTDSSFQARLEKPVEVDGEIALPEGTLFEGKVKTVHARRLNRPGSLLLTFQTIHLPDGSLEGADLSLATISSKSLKVDSEGVIHPRVSKKRMALEIGASLLVGKLADDISETVIAGVTKGVARYIGIGSAVGFYLLQKGREVKVPEGTHFEVVFNRDLKILTPEPGSPQSRPAADKPAAP